MTGKVREQQQWEMEKASGRLTLLRISGVLGFLGHPGVGQRGDWENSEKNCEV